MLKKFLNWKKNQKLNRTAIFTKMGKNTMKTLRWISHTVGFPSPQQFINYALWGNQ